MKKLLLVSLCFLVLCITQVFAQNRTVTGTVTAKDDGLPIPGVTVKTKGTSVGGVPTDVNGKYSIDVPVGSTLVFSFISYLTQEATVTGSGSVNVQLSPDTKQLNEVVVTSLGISQAKKQLGYSQTTVKGETMTRSSPIDLLSGIQGKVAGVNISQTGSTPGATTKVIIRGYGSINGDNQPLYVIDGVPLDNSTPSQNAYYDFGNNANDVDNNNVDNISILKGAEATALYGNRGSNGVILITTKKGKAGKPVVEFNSSTTATQAAVTYTPQNEFGQGWGGVFILSENGDWGPKYDGVLRPWGATGATLGNVQLLKPFSFIKDNVQNTYDTGLEMDNNVRISGGSQDTKYNFSYTNVYSNGILPGPYDLFKKNSFSIGASTTYKNLEISGTLNYTARTGSVPLSGGGNNTTQGNGFYGSLLQIPSDIPIRDLADYKNVFFNTDNYFTPYAENPYYDLAENGSHFTNNHTFGQLNVTYKLADWVKLNFQQGADVTAEHNKRWSNVSIPTAGSWNAGNNVESAIRANDTGSDYEQSYNSFEYDTKLQALFDKKFGSDFSLTGALGATYNDRGYSQLSTYITNLAIPGFYQINNSLAPATSTETDSHRRQFAFYGTATVGYKDYLYATVTGRNDVTSTLSPGNNSYFYPAANISFILSQALGLTPESGVTFAKLRAAYGRTGSDTGPYQTLNTLSATNSPLGFGSLLFPINGVAGYSVNNNLYNPALQPEQITETEIGGEFRFLNDRVTLEATFYNRKRDKLILLVPIAASSGYANELLNFGKTQNKGIELSLGVTPIKTKDITWNLNYQFAEDRSTVLSLPDGASKILLNDIYSVNLYALKNHPLGEFEIPQPLMENGHMVVNTQGLPVQDPDQALVGSIQPQFHMGFSSNLTVKDFDFGFTLDYQQGGKMYSNTAYLLNFVGAAADTKYNDRNPFIIPGSVQSDGAGGYVENQTAITHSNYYSYYNISDNPATSFQNLILTKTYVKLREATLGYKIPSSVARHIGASSIKVSVFGRNLYTWLPASNKYVDPEMVGNIGVQGVSGTGLGGEMGEDAAGPSMRYYGAKLNVIF
ncbi:MAG: TonB-linked outer membrane protein SusC/RagA family [Mucilaginibacter sp.]|nr:TonB-linked outer membrane protein SusC/RagA family [Mucilaginibacter sp.]